MMPFNLTFRKLLLRYFPKLPPEALDRHESLFAYRLQLQHEKSFAPPDVDIKKQNPHRSPKQQQQPIEDTIKRINEESAKIWEENGISKADFDRVHDLWVKRREFALQQRRFSQFPPSGKYLKAWKDYRAAQIRALPVYVKNHLLPTLALALLVLALLIGFLLIDACPSEQTPERLQKEISATETDAGRQAIVKKLEQYYLTMCIPDSIEQRVQAAVEAVLDQPPDVEKWTKTPPDTNAYQLENQLQDLLQDALIFKARNEEEPYRKLMQQARDWGKVVDQGTDNDYWSKWIDKISSFDARAVEKWLQAKEATKLCNQFHQENFRAGEQYGAFGLQLLKHIPDERTRLDIMQRLMTVLYQSHSLYDLTFPFARKKLAKADSLKYHLRAAGIANHYANALYFAGKNQQALEEFRKVVHRARQNKHVPRMNWYEAQGLLGTAWAYENLGYSKKALERCEEIAMLPLDYRQRFEVRNTKALNYSRLSLYDNARNEYQAILDLVIKENDIVRQVITYHNIGVMYLTLSDYNRGEIYLNKALTLFEESTLRDIELKSRILLHYAEILSETNQRQKLSSIIENVTQLIQSIRLPGGKAHLLASLGQLNMKLKNYHSAMIFFQEAISLYHQIGLSRLAIDYTPALIECLINLSLFDDAKREVYKLREWAHTQSDKQAQIDARGLLARIAFHEKKLNETVRQSNQLIREVENLSKSFHDKELLTIFRQRSYPYLHESVRYELERGNIDSAFIKLDNIKARALKSYSTNVNYSDLNIDTLAKTLGNKELLLNYFVTDEQIYVFVLNKRGLSLFHKPVQIKRFERLTHEFLSAIEKTSEIFATPSSDAYQTHYARVSELSDSLYRVLFDWPELQDQLQLAEFTYIVPDNIIYKIPFACLRATRKDSAAFLVQQTAPIQLPSAIFLQEITKKDKSLSQKKVLISVDRSFRESHNLVDFLKRRFVNAEELMVDHPTIRPADILEELNKQFDICVLVGHSESNPVDPNLSTFSFTAIRQSDQKDTTMEITWGNLKNQVDWSQTETVFLIGCETGRGPFYSGTGPVGIQQGLLSEGVKQVVASSWKIDAIHVIPQTIEILKLWQQDYNLASCLRAVQDKAIREYQSDPYYKAPHPYIWAGLQINQTVH